MKPAIQCRDLWKRYGSGTKAVDAVCGLDLGIETGECFLELCDSPPDALHPFLAEPFEALSIVRNIP